jgi:hypothetical protein
MFPEEQVMTLVELQQLVAALFVFYEEKVSFQVSLPNRSGKGFKL